MKKILIFLGPPGSGKGTQAKKIAINHQALHISTGDMLRDLAKSANLSPDQQQAVALMKEGKLVPDELIYLLVDNLVIGCLQNNQCVVFDGVVRTVSQAQRYQSFFEKQGVGQEVRVIDIELSEEETIKRLIGRRVCVKCGTPVEAANTQTVCLKCGNELIARADDSNEILQARLKLQGNEAIKPIREYYQKLGILRRIDGNRPIDVVSKDIESNIN